MLLPVRCLACNMQHVCSVIQKDSDGDERRPSEELMSDHDPVTEDGDTDSSKSLFCAR